MSVCNEDKVHAHNLLLCQRQQLSKRNTRCVVKLVRELIAVKSGANIHKTGCNYELTSRVVATHLDLPGKAEKRKLIALPCKSVFNMYVNSGHKCIEAAIICKMPRYTFFNRHSLHWTTSDDPKAAPPKTVKRRPK